ncbi:MULTISPECIES: nicotinate-nucleotide adenylyltransferase [Paenibacillus]|jgi:nicotinate-nucleotide adenylyltransferase|uniref:Probable nicotinate-nucleotide adenylyltransferase n=2 Tax=Paenibacillus TaxID=44249 RepID=A0ABQ4LGN2_9BACL|nr:MULTISPECIES: nicotinate-nucleotide adenylyltransferase [Paenibacillus]OXL85016.1 nicotinate (nicotinamide) nucleotide adenylyltransferase [Paenibacillus sp. SSG-1]UYO07287.1 nicotinate-nucleotide adenylyltransferase [Paenibacillus sp. PSB04]GIO55699.1 putative nicotinate-nucleotide adenylyltransferase [Paenibacillus cineris]GIO58598.1 putative nicotinate-nucleotide adenylyltransferase [Paenibacillus cineris]
MKVGIMGGTFDPIHIGHLLAAEAARDTFGLDEVWFMPSHIPPHKEQAGATGEQRLGMVAEAIADHPCFRTLDIEIRRGGVSYTIDTVKEIRSSFDNIEFHFIIGADMVNYLPKWEGIEELVELMSFIGVGRPGSTLNLDALPAYLKGKILLADMPQVDISSTEIRERLATGHSIRYMVTDSVYDYIRRRGMYGIQPRRTD